MRKGWTYSSVGVSPVNFSLREQVDAAYREWQAAESYFQEVSDPEAVDVAIYTMEAAQRKYLLLFRQLRRGWGDETQQEG